jgi:hypothetical protein
MGARVASLIVTSIRKGRYKRQLRRPFPGDCHGHLGTEPWGISAERAERIGHGAVGRYGHVDQEVPAIRRWRNVLDKQIVHAIVGIAICEREV